MTHEPWTTKTALELFPGYAPVSCCHSQEIKTTVKLFLAALYWHSSAADDAADTRKSSDPLSRYPEFSLKKERTCLNEVREPLADSLDPSQFTKANKSAAKARLKNSFVSNSVKSDKNPSPAGQML